VRGIGSWVGMGTGTFDLFGGGEPFSVILSELLFCEEKQMFISTLLFKQNGKQSKPRSCFRCVLKRRIYDFGSGDKQSQMMFWFFIICDSLFLF